MRSINGIDRVLKNDAYTIWKNAMYNERRRVY